MVVEPLVEWGYGQLLCQTLVDFTGYLLVWDDRALWAKTIAANLVSEIPLLGSGAAALLFGSPDAADAALVRIYVWHVVLLPALMVVLMAWHFWRVRKDGGISVPL